MKNDASIYPGPLTIHRSYH